MTSLRVVITSVAQRNEGKKSRKGRRVEVDGTHKKRQKIIFSVEIRAWQKKGNPIKKLTLSPR